MRHSRDTFFIRHLHQHMQLHYSQGVNLPLFKFRKSAAEIFRTIIAQCNISWLLNNVIIAHENLKKKFKNVPRQLCCSLLQPTESWATDTCKYTTSNRYNKKVKQDHTPKERRRGAHLPFIGRWARRWINHCCLWRMASAMPDLRLPSQPKLVPIEGWPGWVDLGGWLHTEIVYPPENSHPSRH